MTGVGEDRAACLQLAEEYQDRRLADRAFEMAWTHSQVALRQINVTEADAQLYGRLASSIIFASGSLRADAGVIARNRRGQPGLWGYAISGDLPIVLVELKEPANIELVRQLVQAHAYWRLKGLAVDLVIWNEDHAGYRQLLHDQIMGLIAAGVEAHVIDRPGGIFVRSAEQISNEDRILLQIGDLANIELVRQLVQAHAYWRLKGLTVELVIWNEDHAGYRQLLQDQIMGLISWQDHTGLMSLAAARVKCGEAEAARQKAKGARLASWPWLLVGDTWIEHVTPGVWMLLMGRPHPHPPLENALQTARNNPCLSC